MLKMGLPMGAVKNAVQRDGKDPSVMDLDPNKSIKSQTGSGDNGEEEQDTGVPLKDDPEYSKVNCFALSLHVDRLAFTHAPTLEISTSKWSKWDFLLVR
jgi:hypothetical protein